MKKRLLRSILIRIMINIYRSERTNNCGESKFQRALLRNKAAVRLSIPSLRPLPSFDVILTKQFNFFARFAHEVPRWGTRTDGRTAPSAAAVRPKEQHQLLGNFLGDLHSFSSASDRPTRPPCFSSGIHGLLCFYPRTSNPLYFS